MSEESQEPRRFHYKRTIILLAVLSIISLVSLVYAATIFSNIVTVIVEEEPVTPTYTLTLLAPESVIVNNSITFTGSLMVDSTPVEGVTISILDVNSTSTISTATTIADGSFTCEWTPTAVDTYNFQATCSP